MDDGKGAIMKRMLTVAVTAVVALALSAGVTPAATAATRAVVKTGSCSATSTWKLTLKKDLGRIEADVEVQTSHAGQQWRSRFADNGTVFARVTKTTVADGSFSATRFATNQAGADRIRIRSVNQTTGEVCRATATF